MEQMLEIYLQYEAITESQRETIREQHGIARWYRLFTEHE